MEIATHELHRVTNTMKKKPRYIPPSPKRRCKLSACPGSPSSLGASGISSPLPCVSLSVHHCQTQSPPMSIQSSALSPRKQLAQNPSFSTPYCYTALANSCSICRQETVRGLASF